MPSLDQANVGGPGCWLECDQLGAWLAGHAHLVGSGLPLGSLESGRGRKTASLGLLIFGVN